MPAFIVGILISLVCGTGNAAEKKPFATVQELYSDCKGKDLSLVGCYYFVYGVSQMMRIVGNLETDRTATPTTANTLQPFSLCSEQGITVGQMTQVFTNWAEKNPTEWQEDAATGVWVALQQTWPCPKK